MKLYITLLIGTIILFSGCIRIKSPYTQPTFYRLIQQPLSKGEVATLSTNNNIFIKEFDIRSDLETTKIAIIEDDKIVRYFNYHHWSTTLNELLTEYTIARISRYEIFKNGVAASLYSSNPDLVLECKILDCSINNYKTISRKDDVTLSLSVTLLTADKTSLTYQPLFSKTYTKTKARNNNSLDSAIETMSVLMSNIIDIFLVDIYKSLNN